MSRYRVIVSLNPFVEALLGTVQPMCPGCPPETKAVFNDTSPALALLLGPTRRPCPCRRKFVSSVEADAWVDGLTAFIPDVIAIKPRVEDQGLYALAVTWTAPIPIPAPLQLLCVGCPPETNTAGNSAASSGIVGFTAGVVAQVYQFRIPQEKNFAEWWNVERHNPFFNGMLVLPFEVPD